MKKEGKGAISYIVLAAVLVALFVFALNVSMNNSNVTGSAAYPIGETGASCYWSPDAIHSETELQNAINNAKQFNSLTYVGRANHNKVANITAVNKTSQGSYDDITLLCIDGRWYFSQYQHQNLIYKNGSTIYNSNRASWGAIVVYQPDTYGDWKIVDYTYSSSWKKVWEKQTTTPSPGSCTDGDGGKDYNVKGNVVVTGFSGGPPDSFAEDNCANSITVNEMYCDGIEAKVDSHGCPSERVCSDGACVVPSFSCTITNDLVEKNLSDSLSVSFTYTGNPDNYRFVLGNYNSNRPGTQQELELCRYGPPIPGVANVTPREYSVSADANANTITKLCDWTLGKSAWNSLDNLIPGDYYMQVYLNNSQYDWSGYASCTKKIVSIAPVTELPSGECTITNPSQPVNFNYESLSGGALSITFTHNLAVGDKYGIEVFNKAQGRAPESVYLCSNFTRTITSVNTQSFDCVWYSNRSAVNSQDYLESGTYFANVYIVGEDESEVLCDNKLVANVLPKGENPSVLPGVLCNLPNGKTIPAKARLRDVDNGLKYCSFEGTLQAQKGTGDSCSNDFECQTNLCTDGVCTSLQETTSLLRKVWCALTNPVDFVNRPETYDAENDWWSCVLPPTPACTDSDGGKNYTVKGTTGVTGPVDAFAEDSCSNTNTLQERYCSGNQATTEDYSCPSGTVCSNGACIVSNPPAGQQPSGQTYCTGPTLNCAALSAADCSLAETNGYGCIDVSGVCTAQEAVSCSAVSVADCFALHEGGCAEV